jgi:hypothetical protein
MELPAPDESLLTRLSFPHLLLALILLSHPHNLLQILHNSPRPTTECPTRHPRAIYSPTRLFPPYYLHCIPHYGQSAHHFVIYTIESASLRLTHPFFIALRGRRILLQGRRIGLSLHRLSSGFALLGMRRHGIPMCRGRPQFSQGCLDHRDQGATPTTIAPPQQSGTHHSQATCMWNTW